MDKERRDAIRRELDDPSVDFEPYESTIRALLDMADERDRYRALLDKILTVQRENYGDATMTHILLYRPCEEARAALEGKTNE